MPVPTAPHSAQTGTPGSLDLTHPVPSSEVFVQLRRLRALALSLLVAGGLAACGSSPGSSAAPSSSPTPSAATSVAASGLPSVSGSYGTKPTIAFDGRQPPTALASTVLRQGTGKAVSKGDLLVADYLGQVWGGAVFDNSYDRKAPAGFAIGTGQVIPAWDQVLVGVKAGSRVLMSVPPASGYGSSGNSSAGIKGTDTLVFVVDVVSSYDKTAAGQKDAQPQPVSTPGITISGALGAAPTLSVANGTPAPASPTVTVLAKGSGAPVGTGLVVLQYVATSFTGASAGSSWADGTPVSVAVTGSSAGSPFEMVKTVPLGSRVLLQVPASNGQPATAVVLDLVAQPTSAGA